MKKGNFKRFGSGFMAMAMIASSIAGTGMTVYAATPGKDGSAEMNESYASHESLMPIGPSFSVATLLEWTPESDPDAQYSRASIPLADRKGGFVVNPKANPEAKLMLCSLANATHDETSAQGTEDFMSWSFNYWQYTDSFVYWSGSEEGLICLPTGEFTDAAHTNGVPVVATLGFPWGTGDGYVEEVSAFCQKAADGSFPVADKMIELMDYYGFDGYFFNQESYGCNSEIATRLNEMIHYMRAKRPDMLISWYDSMTYPGGNVSYQDSINDTNKGWMEKGADGSVGINEFFLNYNWNDSKVATTIETMNSIGRNQFDAFAGLDVQQNGMNTAFRDHQLLDEDGKLKLSMALYCPNSTLGNSTSGANFHEVERDFYVNSASDPRVEVSDPTNAGNSDWVGMSRFFADKTPVLGAPFVTNFNSGHGVGYWVDGQLSRDKAWSYQSNQDVMPTWTWIIDSEGSKLSGSYDFTDAYNGGTSIKFSGSLSAGKPNNIMLYSTDIDVTNGMKMSLTTKNGGNAALVAYYGDASTKRYEDCEQVVYDLKDGTAGQWTTTTADMSEKAGKKLYAIGLKIESHSDVSDYKINLGQLTITEQDRTALAGPASVTLDEILYHNAYEAEARIFWDAVDGAVSYEIYKVKADGTSQLIMETPNTAFYIPSVVRDFDEEDVTLKIVPINANGVRGQGSQLTIDWQYTNEDSEKYEKEEFENVCLNAEVTDVSQANDSEPASKALDGTALNGSKWCATNAQTGHMDIRLDKEVTVKRWRVEHAQYGGEDVLMNTVDFALEYKDPTSGAWKEAKRIQNNTAAVTDVLLDTPVTAQEWRLKIYDDGTSPWGGIRIYEWQMFESDQFPQTEPVLIHFAGAQNNAGATDTFTLRNVPNGDVVKVYTKNGDTYKEIGSATAQSKAAATTVTIENLDFGTAEAGRVYYTTTALSAKESIKQSARFEAENAKKSEPATEVTFEKYSQPGSASSSNGDDIFVSMTVTGLNEGDVVYVYDAEPLTREENTASWTKTSLPVAAGETSAVIHGVRIVRAGGKLTLQIKRGGQLISDKYTVETPKFEEPKAKIKLNAVSVLGESLDGVTYGIYDGEGKRIGEAASDALAEVTTGSTYTLKCEKVPEGYRISDTEPQIIVVTEGKTYEIKVTIEPNSDKPIVTEVTVSPATAKVTKGAVQQFTANVTGINNPDKTVKWSVTGANSSATAIDQTGLLAVGADETAKSLTVKAVSSADETKSAEAKVTVEEKATETENVAFNAAIVGYNGQALGGAQGPENLFDGDKTNTETGKWMEKGSNLWVAFDIGESRQVTGLTMHHVGVAEDAAGGKMNTANYEFYILNENKVSVDSLFAMSADERNTVLADNGNWIQLDKTSDNVENVTNNTFNTTGRIFKLNVSRPDTTGQEACVRIYELELNAPKKAEVPVDKAVLNSYIAEAEKLNKAEYTADSWAKLEEALAQAQAVANNNDADQTMVNNAASALRDAMDKLVKGADKSVLKQNIEIVQNELKETDYTPDSWAAVKKALDEAIAVDNDANASQETVNTAVKNLSDAVAALVGRADLSGLLSAIEAAKALQEKDYSVNSWQIFVDAYERAQGIAGNLNATQDAVDEALLQLESAVASLEKAGNPNELKALVDKAKALDLDKYTNESAEAIRQAVSNAEAAIEGRESDENLKAAYDALEKAIADAKEKPSTPVVPENPGGGNKPGDGNKPGGGNKPGDNNKPGSGNSNKPEAPKTGDTMNIGLWAGIMSVSLTAVIAVSAVIVVKRRKKSK